MQAQFDGSGKKHIPSKEVDNDRDVKQKAGEAVVKGEMELRKVKRKENNEKKIADKATKVKK